MTTKIETLVEDIYKLFGSGKQPVPEDLEELGKAMATHIAQAFEAPDPSKSCLRMSNIGTECVRKLWYVVNKPEVAEQPEPWARFKFLYGHLLEELTLFMAQEAGHKVERRQEEVEIRDIKGHIDAFVDGVLVDVKSANSRGMGKFKYHELETNDPFGYIDQLGAYTAATGADRQAFLAVDKELGHLVLDEYPRTNKDYAAYIEYLKAEVAKPEPPSRGYMPEPEGKSGNMKLGTVCSYCPFKKTCWPGLRTFLYSKGPVFLTKVEKLPDVPEK